MALDFYFVDNPDEKTSAAKKVGQAESFVFTLEFLPAQAVVAMHPDYDYVDIQSQCYDQIRPRLFWLRS